MDEGDGEPMKDRNLELASFITSFGSMNNYKSSILQTKKALDLEDSKQLTKTSDEDIFNDALDGITAAKRYGFSTKGIIEINKSFTHSKEEDPKLPGHLRTNQFYNPDDQVVIITDPNGTTKDAYFAPENVYPEDIDEIVSQFNESNKTSKDAWRVFARLSKLQPFQDGNKRTALIAANAALNTWKNKNYLTLPFNNIDHADFMIGLMKFYVAQDLQEEDKALNRMIRSLPSQYELTAHLQSLEDSKDDIEQLKTKNIKSFYGKSYRN